MIIGAQCLGQNIILDRMGCRHVRATNVGRVGAGEGSPRDVLIFRVKLIDNAGLSP